MNFGWIYRQIQPVIAEFSIQSSEILIREAAFCENQIFEPASPTRTPQMVPKNTNFASIFSMGLGTMQKMKSDFALPKNKFEPKYQL